MHPQPSHTRRGITSVLAMMFLVIFGSLSVAMAIMAQGNLRSADSALHVARATSAAQTGLVFAGRRLNAESRRWVVRKGVIDEEWGAALWTGDLEIDGEDVLLLPPEGYETSGEPAGLIEGVLDAHLADEHAFNVEPGDTMLPSVVNQSRLETKPIRMLADDDHFYFRLRYEVVDSPADETRIRVTSEGVDGKISRRISMEFLLTKRIPYAVVSPNRIMIGKNVLIEGPIGTRFGMLEGELNDGNGDPLVMRSDFRYLDEGLTQLIDEFNVAIAAYDVDGDGRLRPAHTIESQPIMANPGFVDVDGDQYVTGFDLFLSTFDLDGDARVVWDGDRAQAAGLGSLEEEFSGIDDQMARLLDHGFRDRNLDGVIDDIDVGLGYNDGVLDAFDLYAKVRGTLSFGVSESEWNTANGAPWRTVVEGSVVSEPDEAPVLFEVSGDQLRDITTEMFAANQSWYATQASAGEEFSAQINDNLASDPDAEFIPAGSATWESVPEGSPNPYDWYQRPIYRNMIFTDTLLPMGTNARFENCIFVGTTYVQTATACSHPNWNYLGAIERIEDAGGSVSWEPKFSGLEEAPDPSGTGTIADTKLASNNLAFHECTIVGALAGDRPVEYTHWRNKLQFSGATRFFLDADDPDLLSQPDASLLIGYIESFSTEQKDAFARSMMMMPGWSVEVGNFANEQSENWEATPVVKLRGTIIAGVLDARGTADVFGTLLMTFRPQQGVGPLFYGGNPDQFNTTLGYFGPHDGDLEGIDPSADGFAGFGEIFLRYDPDAKLPDGIPWPMTTTALPSTYSEGAQQ